MTSKTRIAANSIDQIFGALFGDSPDYEAVSQALISEDFHSAFKRVRKIMSNMENPVKGLESKIRKHLPGLDLSGLDREAIRSGNYDSVFKFLEDLITGEQTLNAYAQNTTAVAKIICGSLINYNGDRNSMEGIITRVAAYTHGLPGHQGYDIPGTVGIWHSNAQGGYDVALISAHPDIGDKTGAIAIFSIKPFVKRKYGHTITGKSAIANQWGFKDPGSYDQQVQRPSSPLQIILRQAGVPIIVNGARYKATPEGEIKEAGQGDDELLGCYKLVRV